MVKHQSIPIYSYVGIMAVETIRLGFCLLVIGVATSLQIEICQIPLSSISSGKRIDWLQLISQLITIDYRLITVQIDQGISG